MTDILSNNKIPRIYAYTEPQFKETPWKNGRQGEGLIKVGFTTKSSQERIAEHFNEEVKDFSREIAENRDDSLSDFVKALEKVYYYKDKNDNC